MPRLKYNSDDKKSAGCVLHSALSHTAAPVDLVEVKWNTISQLQAWMGLRIPAQGRCSAYERVWQESRVVYPL